MSIRAILFELPIRLVNGANSREHWARKARRTRQERLAASLATPLGVAIPCTITCVRRAPRAFDSDGLAISFKAIRDGIADKLKINDGSDAVKWCYAQEKSKSYGIRIEVAHANLPAWPVNANIDVDPVSGKV